MILNVKCDVKMIIKFYVTMYIFDNTSISAEFPEKKCVICKEHTILLIRFVPRSLLFIRSRQIQYVVRTCYPA